MSWAGRVIAQAEAVRPIEVVEGDTAEVGELLARARAVAERCAANASAIDHEGAFPTEEFGWLADAGLLAAPLGHEWGGLGLGIEPARTLPTLLLLRAIGRGNLAVGRLYEGHVNALQLVQTFGTPEQAAASAADARDGRALFGVWNTEPPDGVKIVRIGQDCYRMEGAKRFASGAGDLRRALVTGTLAEGDPELGWQICLVPMDRVDVAIDRSWWQPLGMRATASYRVDFTGVGLGGEAMIGAPGDYYRQPWFGGGAVRFAAVQLGGADALFAAMRDYLRDRKRAEDPHRLARAGQAAIAVAGGDNWLRAAAELVARHGAAYARDNAGAAEEVEAVVAHANMTRLAIEALCREVAELARRSVGARGLLRPHPIERIWRDLMLYLCQAGPDAALEAVGRRALQGP